MKQGYIVPMLSPSPGYYTIQKPFRLCLAAKISMCPNEVQRYSVSFNMEHDFHVFEKFPTILNDY